MEFRPTFSTAVFFTLSLAYLAAEFAFNAMMLDVAGAIAAPIEEVERVKDFGRVVSASGFTLLMLGLFSRAGYRLLSWREWAVAAVVFAFCMSPAILLMLSDVRFGVSMEGFLCFTPVLGLAALVMSGGRYRIYVVLGVIMMAWPAMFAGQKIIIDQYAVAKTTWQERAEARNVLMLRASLEDCVVDLGDSWLCGRGAAPADMRSVRAMITALWMHAPGRVVTDLGDKQDKIIEDMAHKGVWFSPGVLYDRYVDRTTDEYNKYISGMEEKYYAPYKKASDAFLARRDEATLEKAAQESVAEVEARIDDGWKEYQEGLKSYRNHLATMKKEALQALPNARLADAVCDNGRCPELDLTKALERAQKKAQNAFTKASGGYPSDIKTREEFVAHPKTQADIRDAVEKSIREKTTDDAYILPQDWVYSANSFRILLKSLYRDKTEEAWNKKFQGKVEPGLSRDDFFRKAGKGDIPDIADVIMTEEEFMKTKVVPKNREIVQDALKEMRSEAPHYANGQMLEEKGKNYVRAAYIPAVALVISLIIVLLTLARGIAAGLAWLEERGQFFPDMPYRHLMRVGAMTTVVLFMMVGPYLFPNPYTSAEAYKKYLGFAKERNVVTAAVLDWAIHIQPFIYQPGGAIRSIGDNKK